MTFRTRFSVLGLAVLLTAGAWMYAQERLAPGRPSPSQVGTINPMDLVAPEIIAGPNLGFRLESTTDGVAVGRFVVRIDGRWLDAQVGSSGVILQR
jgi:hypothetical protein